MSRRLAGSTQPPKQSTRSTVHTWGRWWPPHLPTRGDPPLPLYSPSWTRSAQFDSHHPLCHFLVPIQCTSSPRKIPPVSQMPSLLPSPCFGKNNLTFSFKLISTMLHEWAFSNFFHTWLRKIQNQNSYSLFIYLYIRIYANLIRNYIYI